MMTCISCFFPPVICSRCPEWSNYQDSYSERSWTWHGEPAGVWYSCHWAQPLEDPSGHWWRQPQQSCNLSSAYIGSGLCGRCKWEYWGEVLSITYSNYYSEVPKVRARLRFGNLVVESWISEILKIFLIMLCACSYLRYLVKRQMWDSSECSESDFIIQVYLGLLLSIENVTKSLILKCNCGDDFWN